ncbi:MAG: metallophosphoesterase family protein [Methanobacteriaceae archaeon]
MKFAHLSDTHLGYRQYGIEEREEDFYNVFNETVDKIIEERVDFVLHSGDLFETSRPSTRTLLIFQEAFIKLKEANIPIYAIAGNHDIIMRKNAIPPQLLFKKLGLKLISPNYPSFIHDDILITGTPYVSKPKADILKEKLAELSKHTEENSRNYSKSILLLHQGIDKYINYGEDSFELEIGDVPTNFNYYACGHLHNRIIDDFGNGKLVFPGSMEIWRANELDYYKDKGKGFSLVDISGDVPEVENINIELPREFINKVINYNSLETEINKLNKHISTLKNNPILNITVKGKNFNRSDTYEFIDKSISIKCLSLRPNFTITEDFDISDIDINESIGSKELMVERLKSLDNEDITFLATNLMDFLSVNNQESARVLLKSFYRSYFQEELNESIRDIDLSDIDNIINDTSNDIGIDNNIIGTNNIDTDDTGFDLDNNQDNNIKPHTNNNSNTNNNNIINNYISDNDINNINKKENNKSSKNILNKFKRGS